MTRTLTFTPRIWAALDAEQITLPMARALQMIEQGASIYSAAKALDGMRGKPESTPPKALRRLQIAWVDLQESGKSVHAPTNGTCEVRRTGV